MSNLSHSPGYLCSGINKKSFIVFPQKHFLMLLVLMLSMSGLKAGEQPEDTLRSVLKSETPELVLEVYEKLVSPLFNSNPEKVLQYAGLLENYADSIDNLKAKALAYRFYASVYNAKAEYQRAIVYWKKQLEAELIIGDKKNTAYTYLILGGNYQQLSYFDSAEASFHKSYDLLTEINDTRGLGFYYANLAQNYDRQGLLRQGINTKYEALGIAESINDSAQIAHILTQIGVSYARLEEHAKAIEKYEQSLKMLLKNNNKTEAFHTMSNMGVAFNSLQETQKALDTYEQSLQIAKEIGYEYGEAIASMNIGEILLKLNRPDSVMQFLKRSEEIFNQLGARHPLCYNYKVLGNYYLKNDDKDNALKYLQKAFDLSKELNAPDLHRDAAAHLYSLQKENGNYKAALNYHEIFKQYSDSLLNAENIAELTKMEEQFKYEQDKKQTDLLHRAALDKRHIIIILVSTGLSLALVLLILAIVQYRHKNAAYLTLYNKSMAQIREAELKRNREGLKNGELYEQVEQKMQDERLYRIKDLSQDMIAEMLKTNRTYVSQTIIDHSGKKFREYIKEYRIKEAMEILADPKKSIVYSIDAISEMVGFNSIATFNAAFKQFTGLTPSQFRSRSPEKSSDE
jgi:AraC-like DNA-binding protein